MAERGTKSTASRVKESIELIGKFKELGVAESEPGLVNLRTQMNEWIRGGLAWSGRIEFPRYDRYAEVNLPDREGRIASIAFNRYR
jgi:hypothetical protein